MEKEELFKLQVFKRVVRLSDLLKDIKDLETKLNNLKGAFELEKNLVSENDLKLAYVISESNLSIH